jgi:hypothetical protein
MPTGPKGEKRPADVIGGAITVAKLSVGDITEPLKKPSGRIRSGQAGAKARTEKFTPARGQEIAKKASQVRWG